MKKIKLILDTPCSERWDEMVQTGAGRFCGSCEKHVVDLTTKSDEEIIQFFKRKKENVCGRVLARQLNRDLVVLSPKADWHWLLSLAVGTIAFTPALAKELRPITINSGQVSAIPSAYLESAVHTSAMQDSITPL